MNTSPVTKTRRQALPGSFGLWVSWVAYSTLGYYFSLMIALGLLSAGQVFHMDPGDTLSIMRIILLLVAPTNVIGGLLVGGLQYDLLRRRLERPRTWIVWTALGWIFAGLVPFISLFTLELEFLTSAVLTGLVAGTIMGICQWMVLRRTVKAAIWWIPASALDWVLAMLALALGQVLADVVIPIIGVVTGLALVLLLDRSDYGAQAPRSWH